MNPDSPNLDLTIEEKGLLKKHLRFYVALAKGMRLPLTPAQKHFVDATLGRAPAETPHERAYLKHVRLQKQNQTSGPIRDPEIDGQPKVGSLEMIGRNLEAVSDGTVTLLEHPSMEFRFSTLNNRRSDRSMLVIWSDRICHLLEISGGESGATRQLQTGGGTSSMSPISAFSSSSFVVSHFVFRTSHSRSNSSFENRHSTLPSSPTCAAVFCPHCPLPIASSSIAHPFKLRPSFAQRTLGGPGAQTRKSRMLSAIGYCDLIHAAWAGGFVGTPGAGARENGPHAEDRRLATP